MNFENIESKIIEENLAAMRKVGEVHIKQESEEAKKALSKNVREHKIAEEIGDEV